MSYEFHRADEVLEIKLAEKLPAGSQATLTIDYIGFINDNMSGFYRSSYEDSETGTKRYLAATQFEATDARKAFPCWDEPAVKSNFTITLVIPKNLVGLSNMDEDSRTEVQDGKVAIMFKESPIMSTYLVAWVVGDLDYIEQRNEDDILIRVYATRGLVHQGKFALDVASRTLEIFTRYFDQPYPLPKLDMVALPDFSNGAMENWGLVTYCTFFLLFDEKDSSLKTKQEIAYTVAHELAHQWFGNLVTMEWWSDLWLNEGFATWAGWFAVDRLFAEWDIWTDFLVGEFQSGLSLDGLRSSHPVEVPVKNGSDIVQIFDSISYSKGASIIRMLVKMLGEDVFQKGMRSYLAKHKYMNAKTADLWASLSEASGQSVADIMASWTQIVGYPALTVEAKHEDSKLVLEVTQNRFLNSEDVKEEENQTVWTVPLRLVTNKDNEFTAEAARAVLKSRTTTIELPADTSYFKFNYQQAGFYRVHYPSQWLQKLGEAIEAGKLSPSDRIGVVSDMFAMSFAGKLSLSEVLNVLRFFKNEDDYIVWGAITSRLTEVLSVWWEQEESTIDQLNAFTRNIYARQVQLLGFDSKEGEGDQVSLLRPLIIGMAGKCDDESVIREARERFDRFIAGDLQAIHPDLRGVVFSIVISHGGQKEYDQVFDIYQKSTVADQKITALGALGFSRDSLIIQAALNLTLHEDIIRPQDVMYLFRSVGLNTFGRRMCWQCIVDNWSFFYEHFYKANPTVFTYIVPCAIREFSQDSDADAIQKFLADKDVPSVDRAIQQSLEKVRSNAAWLNANKANVAKWLINYFA